MRPLGVATIANEQNSQKLTPSTYGPKKLNKPQTGGA